MLAPRLVAALLAASSLAGCARASRGSPAGDAGAPSASSAASAPSAAPLDVPPLTGRVFFGKSPTQTPEIAVQELWVGRDASGVRAFFLGDGEDDELRPALDGDGHLRWTTKIPSRYDLALAADGTFTGEQRYGDGSASTWVRVPFEPVARLVLVTPTGFEGFLDGRVRYRVEIALHGDAAQGVARYVGTREELRLRGTIDRAARVLHLDETDGAGKLTGRIDASLLGRPVDPKYVTRFALAGTWSSPDGARRLPLHLASGYYPARVTADGGRALSAQESYVRECDRVTEYVYPVLDGAPPALAAPFDRALQKMTSHGPSPDEPTDADAAKITPESRVSRSGCKDDPEARGTTSGVYSATKLRGSWVAIDLEHYDQEGTVRGHAWHACVVADLATGEIVPTIDLLDEATLQKLEARARKDAIAAAKREIGDGGDVNDEGTLRAAKDLSLRGAPLCIDDREVKLAIVQHPVFGPAAPSYDRDAFARMLPPGKLRDLVSRDAK